MVVNPKVTVRKIVSLPRDTVSAIERFRFGNHVKTEAEAIRRLIDLGLEAARATAALSSQ